MQLTPKALTNWRGLLLLIRNASLPLLFPKRADTNAAQGKYARDDIKDKRPVLANVHTSARKRALCGFEANTVHVTL